MRAKISNKEYLRVKNKVDFSNYLTREEFEYIMNYKIGDIPYIQKISIYNKGIRERRFYAVMSRLQYRCIRPFAGALV